RLTVGERHDDVGARADVVEDGGRGGGGGGRHGGPMLAHGADATRRVPDGPGHRPRTVLGSRRPPATRSPIMIFEETVVLEGPFDEALAKTKEAFAAEGFGTLTEIDVQATLAEKIDKEMD